MATSEESLKIPFRDCPIGVFQFCAVIGQGILNKDASTRKQQIYEYKVSLNIPKKDAGGFIDIVDKFMEDNMVKGDEICKLAYQTSDDWDGVPDDMVQIVAKARTKWEDNEGESQSTNISIFNAKNNKVKLPEGTGIGKGSTGRISGTLRFWENSDGVGCTLWLSGVQIGHFKPYEFEDTPDEIEGDFEGFEATLEEVQEESRDRGERSRDRGERSRDRGERSRDRGERSRDRGERSRDRGERSRRSRR